MNRRRVSFVYRLGVITSLFLGIVLSFATTTNARYLLSYYTTQSNLLCFVSFLFLLIGDLVKYNYRKREWYYFWKGAITITILVTMLVYLVALLPNDLPMYTVSSREAERWGKIIGNLLLHVISPLLVIFDYYFFDVKGKFGYFFLDYEKIGREGVIVWLTLIAMGIVTLRYILVFWDRRKVAKNKTKDNTS